MTTFGQRHKAASNLENISLQNQVAPVQLANEYRVKTVRPSSGGLSDHWPKLVGLLLAVVAGLYTFLSSNVDAQIFGFEMAWFSAAFGGLFAGFLGYTICSHMNGQIGDPDANNPYQVYAAKHPAMVYLSMFAGIVYYMFDSGHGPIEIWNADWSTAWLVAFGAREVEISSVMGSIPRQLIGYMVAGALAGFVMFLALEKLGISSTSGK